MQVAALEGIKVLDLTHHIAGPYCTKLLADFGAEVIKIERPGRGDAARRMGPFYHDEPHPDKSLLFMYLNTSKIGVTLDLRSTSGRVILNKLVADADVIVENFHPSFLPSLGITYEGLREINPGLIMVSISNFGQSGPYRDFQATDIVEYALGGLMYIFGSTDREPLVHALHQAQFKAGVDAAGAANIAVLHHQLTGQGQWVDISIQECITTAIRDTTSVYSYWGAIKGRMSTNNGELPRGPIEVKDGYILPISFGGVNWDDLAEFLHSPDLRDSRFATLEGRMEHFEEFSKVLQSAFGTREKYEIFQAAHQERRLIYGVVQEPKEVLSNPQYEARAYFVELEHPVAGTATYPGAPFIMSQTPWQARSPAPTLGQHNQDVLCERLGYSRAELTRLTAAGVI